MNLSDQEIVERLLDKDESVTHWFFYTKCRPLFLAIIKNVINYPVSYAEVVNEIYILLFEHDARRLRQFDFRSSLCQWLKVVIIHYLLRNKDRVIDGEADEPRYDVVATVSVEAIDAHMTVEAILGRMTNSRYVLVIRELVLKDREPKDVAVELGVTVDNLYNIKKRALAEFRAMAINDNI